MHITILIRVLIEKHLNNIPFNIEKIKLLIRKTNKAQTVSHSLSPKLLIEFYADIWTNLHFMQKLTTY